MQARYPELIKRGAHSILVSHHFATPSRRRLYAQDLLYFKPPSQGILCPDTLVTVDNSKTLWEAVAVANPADAALPALADINRLANVMMESGYY